MNDAFNDALLI